MSLPLKIKGKRVAKARNIELLEVPISESFPKRKKIGFIIVIT